MTKYFNPSFLSLFVIISIWMKIKDSVFFKLIENIDKCGQKVGLFIIGGQGCLWNIAQSL